MKPNGGAFSGKETRNRSNFSGFETGNSFPVSKAPRKTAPFSAVSGERTSRTKCYRGCNRREVMKLSVRERRRWTNLGELPTAESRETASSPVPGCNRGHDG